jgi:plastocyanin
MSSLRAATQREKIRWFHILGGLLFTIALTACGGSATAHDEIAIRAPSDRSQPAGPRGLPANSSETRVNVVMTDFAYTLDVAEASAGTITFLVENHGGMPHDFAIEGNGGRQKTAMLEPGQTASLTVDLKPGTYTYLCTVPGHALLGMKGTFMVTE